MLGITSQPFEGEGVTFTFFFLGGKGFTEGGGVLGDAREGFRGHRAATSRAIQRRKGVTITYRYLILSWGGVLRT
jgi:hypothetical protein